MFRLDWAAGYSVLERCGRVPTANLALGSSKRTSGARPSPLLRGLGGKASVPIVIDRELEGILDVADDRGHGPFRVRGTQERETDLASYPVDPNPPEYAFASILPFSIQRLSSAMTAQCHNYVLSVQAVPHVSL